MSFFFFLFLFLFHPSIYPSIHPRFSYRKQKSGREGAKAHSRIGINDPRGVQDSSGLHVSSESAGFLWYISQKIRKEDRIRSNMVRDGGKRRESNERTNGTNLSRPVTVNLETRISTSVIAYDVDVIRL